MESFKWSLVGYPIRYMEESVADSGLNCVSLLAQEFSEKNLSIWPRDCSCNILVKNVAAFCFVQGICLRLILMKNVLMKQNKLRKVKYKMYASKIKRYQKEECIILKFSDLIFNDGF